jgi:hypothetical protein
MPTPNIRRTPVYTKVFDGTLPNYMHYPSSVHQPMQMTSIINTHLEICIALIIRFVLPVMFCMSCGVHTRVGPKRAGTWDELATLTRNWKEIFRNRVRNGSKIPNINGPPLEEFSNYMSDRAGSRPTSQKGPGSPGTV